ncbi:MAG TPA: formate/nitrite transporter [Ruminococcaceae bacterium]|nr:formate/nitrite transporter [Oscillospiraceae bacterium]
MLKTLRESLCAGILITIGGTVFLSCENKVIGAVLFSVALLCICYKGYYLFTGKIGYIVEQHEKADFVNLAVGLFGNLIVTFLIGMMLREVLPNIGDKAAEMCSAKLAQYPLHTFIRGFFCGILMYLAVSIYKEKNTALGVLFCVPVFILCGFEHSIADMYYFGVSGIFSARIVLFMALVVAGNTLGAMILPLLKGVKADEKQG